MKVKAQTFDDNGKLVDTEVEIETPEEFADRMLKKAFPIKDKAFEEDLRFILPLCANGGYFEPDCTGEDVGYLHIKGLEDSETINNNGPDIQKMIGLVRVILCSYAMKLGEKHKLVCKQLFSMIAELHDMKPDGNGIPCEEYLWFVETLERVKKQVREQKASQNKGAKNDVALKGQRA